MRFMGILAYYPPYYNATTELYLQIQAGTQHHDTYIRLAMARSFMTTVRTYGQMPIHVHIQLRQRPLIYATTTPLAHKHHFPFRMDIAARRPSIAQTIALQISTLRHQNLQHAYHDDSTILGALRQSIGDASNQRSRNARR